MFLCPHCAKSFDRLKSRFLHIRLCPHRLSFICHCGTRFHNKPEFDAHKINCANRPGNAVITFINEYLCFATLSTILSDLQTRGNFKISVAATVEFYRQFNNRIEYTIPPVVFTLLPHKLQSDTVIAHICAEIERSLSKNWGQVQLSSAKVKYTFTELW